MRFRWPWQTPYPDEPAPGAETPEEHVGEDAVDHAGKPSGKPPDTGTTHQKASKK